MKKGERAHITARGLTLDGDAVADLDGRRVLVPGLFPAERAQVRITAVSKQHARAHGALLQLESPHPARRNAPCPNHEARGGACSGCALMELEESAQRELKREMLRANFGLDVAHVESTSDVLGYRWSSKRVAFGQNGRLRLGSFARGSHEPAPMSHCLVDHPRVRDAFDECEARCFELGIEPYDERSGHGDLRYVWAKTNGSQVIVTLITASHESRAATSLAPALRAAAGVSWSVQPARSNAVRGSVPTLLCGLERLSTTLLGHEVDVGALGFLQPNPAVAELAYEALTQLDDAGAPRELALDLYAGAGVTTRRLSQFFARVIPCEAYPESAASLGVAPQTVEEFLAERLPQRDARRPSMVIANPPRKGMGPAVCRQLLALEAPELRIMSCGPEGLARDLATLNAGYQLVSLRAFDTLPQTPHVELVARLQHRAAGPTSVRADQDASAPRVV